MKLSLLELTQNILSSMDSEEINSVSDTTEAKQVTKVLETVYYNIIARSNLPEHRQIFSLDASGETALPVVMYRPDHVTKLEWIKYNIEDEEPVTEPFYAYVTLLPLQQFRDMTDSFDPTEDDVEQLSLNGFTFFYKNDKMPEFCTVINDDTLIFDSYDSEVDDTLQASKTVCYGVIAPTFDTDDDNFIPDLDEQQFPLLLNEAKSLAFLELKQMTHEKAEQESRRQWRTLQRTKQLADVPTSFDQLPNFGRR
jgi:hypothetical protein